MSTSRAVPGFLPSTSGLGFRNTFPPGPTLRLGPIRTPILGIGDASAGLCGGMCWDVRRRFVAGRPVPADTTAPANGSQLFRALVREQLRSLRLGIVPWRFWRMARLTQEARTRRTHDVEWPRIRASLDAGRLIVVGLVRVAGATPLALTANHQVVAYGYETTADGDTRIRLYDPNWPGRDDVTIPVAVPSVQSTGEPLLGFLALA